MPVVAVVVSFVGAQVGTALLGATLGATVAGAVGAGIASGLYAEATGGDFGKGFLSGAVGNVVGGMIGDAFGGVGDAAGLTQDAMLAEQMAGFSGVGDITGELGWGDTIGSTGSAGFGSSVVDAGMGDFSSDLAMQPYTDPLQGGSLDTASSYTPQFDDQMIGVNSGFNLDNLSGQNTNNYFNLDTPQFDDQMIGVANTPTAQQGLGDITAQPQTGEVTAQPRVQSLGEVNTTQGSTGGGIASPAPGGTTNPAPATGGFMDKVKGMVNSSDQWLNQTLGMPKGSTAMGLMGVASYMQDSYNTYKMEQIAKGLKPMTLEQFQSSYYNPNDYKSAANTMAKSGHTGTLPVLMARMNAQSNQDYVKNYLPNAQANWWNANAQIGQSKSNAVGNLIAPWATAWTMGNMNSGKGK